MARAGAVESVPGFRFAGVSAGIKKRGGPDLALIVADAPASAAGVFTRSRLKAAPVQVTASHVRHGLARAVIVNSGNANAATGAQGLADARETADLVGRALGVPRQQVLVCSTGVIGRPMPMDRVRLGLPKVIEALSAAGTRRAADAILTTDTRRKIASARVPLDRGRAARMVGFAKGAGMIRPDMATMLAFVMTDAPVEAPTLRALLARTAERTFNRISIDGDMSTNDTVIALAGGAAGGAPLAEGTRAYEAFAEAFEELALELALDIVRDGEGATRTVEVEVRGGRTEAEALTVARTVAESLLVKTAIHGADPNWGRILAAACRSGVAIDPAAVRVEVGGVLVYDRGKPAGDRALTRASRGMRRMKPVPIRVELDRGSASGTIYTCDLSAEYVRINSEYTT